MGTYNSAILTDAGQSLIANAISGGGVVQFTNVQTSSYAYPPGTNIPSLTELQDVQQTEAPFSAQVFNDTMIQVSSRFDNSAVSEAYLIQTIGIFAQLGSDPAVLFAVVQATTPDQMPASSAVSPSAFIYNVQITVQQASSITVTVNPAGTATVQDILDIQANYVPNSKIDNNLLGTDPTHVLASPQGKALADKTNAISDSLVPDVTVVDSSQIPNYVSGLLTYSVVGNIIFIQVSGLEFSDQSGSGPYIPHTIPGFPENINAALVNCPCMNNGVINGELVISEGSLEVRTLSTTPIFGYLCYPTSPN